MRLTTVTLRRRSISGGRESLFFDYYPAIRNPETMKMVRWEYIGIYIWEKPRNAIERDYNNEMLMKAEAIRSMRVQSIINEEFGFLDKHKRTADFLAYFKKHAMKKYTKFHMAYKHFEHYCKGHCTFGDLTVEFCRKYGEYLATSAHSLKLPDRKLSANSASAYFSTFRAELKTAYKEKMLRENLNDFLDSIEQTDTHKEYLTLNKVKILSSTPCRHDILRMAALLVLERFTSERHYKVTLE